LQSRALGILVVHSEKGKFNAESIFMRSRRPLSWLNPSRSS
jgi:hypothetical protein